MLARQPLAGNVSPASHRIPVPLKERLIVALDVPTVGEARAVVEELGDSIQFYKVGMQLQFARGLEFVDELINQHKKKVFLDSKLLDIGETIKGAVANIAKMGVTFLTVHGERKAIEAAVMGRGSSDLKILAVTFLTSLDKHDLKDLHFSGSVEEFVLFRARLAFNAGADGVITSGQEAKQVREIVGNKLTIVTPGIRPQWATSDDQRRVVSPLEAIEAGADYLVVGRPILKSTSRPRAVEKIFSEISQGISAREAVIH
jgi:orotidine-5'-phosphate decarboxylase